MLGRFAIVTTFWILLAPGAYGAPLLKYLDPSHYDVNLTREQFRRVTMWLDCNSNELGAYRNEDAQRRGEIVWPVFDVP